MIDRPIYDFNVFERSAEKLKELGRFDDALQIYLFMADGDTSLDAGYLGMRIGECYEALGRPREALYWYRRSTEENPGVWEVSENAVKRLDGMNVDHLLISK